MAKTGPKNETNKKIAIYRNQTQPRDLEANGLASALWPLKEHLNSEGLAKTGGTCLMTYENVLMQNIMRHL